MRVYFSKKERAKHIEFTKRLYGMEELQGYVCFFDKFLENEWRRVTDKGGSLEDIINLMKNTKTIVSSLSIAEDEHIPFRYTVNPLNMKKDRLFEINFDLTSENFCKIQELYFEIYGRFLQDDSKKGLKF